MNFSKLKMVGSGGTLGKDVGLSVAWWTMLCISVSTADSLPPKFRLSNRNRNLTIVNVCKNCDNGQSDLQVIQCNASNTHGYAFAAGYINVLCKNPTAAYWLWQWFGRMLLSSSYGTYYNLAFFGHFILHLNNNRVDSIDLTQCIWPEITRLCQEAVNSVWVWPLWHAFLVEVVF